MNALKIYKSSAGSGKTFTLVREYLKLALAQPDDYRHILAITFTNKAAEEMKSRIVEALVELRSGQPSPLRELLEKDLPGINLTSQAETVLRLILHDYPSFSISTIDSFFQRLLRALAREIHLPLRAEIQLQEADAVLEVVDRLLNESSQNADLAKWLKQLYLKKIEEDKGWNIEGDIASIAREMLKERGKDHKVLSREEIHAFMNEMQKIRKRFESRMAEIGKETAAAMDKNGFTVADFSYGKNGPANYFFKIQGPKKPEDYKIGGRTKIALDDPDQWLTNKHRKDPDRIAFVEKEIVPRIRQASLEVETNYNRYITSIQILRTLFLFGIVNDLERIFAQYRKENNQILISDTPRLLQHVISGDDTPFIYEKTGNRYKYLLIDEFQDTSEIQWQNLLPLIINSLGSGFMTLIVGDAKQSIYRWRGGQLQLLLRGIRNDLSAFSTLFSEHVLDVNYRSKKEIIQFNNNFFHNVHETLAGLDENLDLSLLQEAYGKGLQQEVAQKNNSGGFVMLRFIEKDQQAEDPSIPEKEPADPPAESESAIADTEPEEEKKWKEKAMDFTVGTIRDLLLRGFRYKDIAILVRSNKEGNLIAQHLFSNGIDKIISPDSLLISGSPVVRFLINALRILADPLNNVAKSQALYFYVTQLKHEPSVSMHELFVQKRKTGRKKNDGNPIIDPDALTANAFNRYMPQEFVEQRASLAKLPVYEISEQLLRIFGLNQLKDAYIQRFQDLVLEYNIKQHASVNSFLSWWDLGEQGEKVSVVIPENENAIRIMSIHRSKGLQFPVVIIPFAEWELKPKTGELIWMNTTEEPFNELGRIGLYADDKLSDSVYSADWLKEKGNTVIDNVNLLYVAFTRPEEELYVFSPAGTGNFKRVSHLLRRNMNRMDYTPDDQSVIRIGEPCREPSKRKTATATEELPSYPSNQWQEKINIASSARNLSGLVKERRLGKIRYGLQVHALLSEIKNASELELRISEFNFDGTLAEDEKNSLRDKVREVLEHPDIKPFFETDWTVLREQEILLPDAGTLRPDRVLVKDHEAMIIDFKSGKESPSHRLQIENYADTLLLMGYSTVRKFLIYLEELRVVELPAHPLAKLNASS